MDRSAPGNNSCDLMSSGVGGARLTQPPPGPAVKVFTKNDSLPSIRLRSPNRPPLPMSVFISTPCCAAIAPGSALIDSPCASSMVSKVYEGLNSMLALIGGSLCRRRAGL